MIINYVAHNWNCSLLLHFDGSEDFSKIEKAKVQRAQDMLNVTFHFIDWTKQAMQSQQIFNSVVLCAVCKFCITEI